MNRKEFIKTTAISSLAFSTPLSLFAGGDKKREKLTILHTNDQHSRIEPFDSSNKKFGNKGGVATRAAMIQKIREEEKHVLLFDAGDIFQGTPYFNFFGGELEFKLMSMMGYDAATMGNHDFDNGLEGFNKQLPNAKFDFICSNYNFKNTLLEGKTMPYKIFKKAGIKIGVFGLGVAFEGLVIKEKYKETQYLDPIETAQEMTKILKQEGCNLIICLSHLGYDYKETPNKISDKILAKRTKDIDFIIGGHTHTFLDKPEEYINLDNRPVLVNQVGWSGLVLGRVDFEIDFSTQDIKPSTLTNLIVKEPKNYLM